MTYNSIIKYTANNSFIKNLFFYTAICSVVSVLFMLLISIIEGIIKISNIVDILLYFFICIFCLWSSLYVFRIIRISKLQITNQKIFLRRWENGLYPEKVIGGSLHFPKYIEDAIAIEEVDSIIMCKGNYLLQLGKSIGNNDILNQMYSSHPLFKSSEIPILCVVDKNNRYFIINLNHYSLNKIRKWIAIADAIGIRIKKIDDVIKI